MSRGWGAAALLTLAAGLILAVIDVSRGLRRLADAVEGSE